MQANESAESGKMGIILEFTVPPKEFVLGRLLRVEPDIVVQVEQLVPMKDKIMPFSWVSGDIESFEENIKDEVGYQVILTDDVNRRKLYRLEWDADGDELIKAIIDSDGAVSDAKGNHEEWRFTVRFRNHNGISQFHNYCAEHGIEMSIQRIYNPIEVSNGSHPGMTAIQMQTLVDALEEGYFDIPRKTSLAKLGEKYGISDQAVSERLRRATAGFIRSSLAVEDKPMAVSRGDD